MRCRIRSIRAAFFGTWLLASTVTALEITKGPYLQNVTQTSIVVMWETDIPSPSRVEYGSTDQLGKEAVSDEKVKIHEVTMPGLDPDTRYHYRVSSAGQSSGVFSFLTAVGKGKPFRFIVYGDSRSVPETHAKVIQTMIPYRPRFVIHTGDIVGSGEVYEKWGTEFFGPVAPLIRTTPFVAVYGGHEMIHLSDNYLKFFSNPNDPELWFSFDCGDAHFAAFASEHIEQLPGNLRAKQGKWFEEDLARSNAKWKFAIWHVPPYSAERRGSYGEREGARPQIDQLEKHGVDMTFHGHHHTFQRSYPLKRGKRHDEHGVVYVITAGGGAPVAPVGARWFTAHATSQRHFTVVDIDGDLLRLKAVNIDGDVIDEYARTKDPTLVDKLLKRLDKEEGPKRLETEKLLGELAYLRSGAQLSALYRSTDDQEERKVLLRALARIGASEAEEIFLAAIAESDTATRMDALLGLQNVRSKKGVEPIVALLGTVDGEPLQACIRALQKIGGAAVIPAAKKLLDHPVKKVHRGALLLLKELSTPEAVKVYVDHARRLGPDTGNTRLRGEELFALFKLADTAGPEFVPMMKTLVHDEDDDISAAAVAALEDMRWGPAKVDVDIVAVAGYVPTWLTLGPFLSSESGENLGITDGPVDPERTFPTLAGDGKWRKTNRWIIFCQTMYKESLKKHSELSAYALAYLNADAEKDVRLKFGGAADVTVWLNGEKILFAPIHSQPYYADNHRVSTRLRQGRNVLVMRLDKPKYRKWRYWARVLGLDNRPVPGLKFSLDQGKSEE